MLISCIHASGTDKTLWEGQVSDSLGYRAGTVLSRCFNDRPPTPSEGSAVAPNIPGLSPVSNFMVIHQLFVAAWDLVVSPGVMAQVKLVSQPTRMCFSVFGHG